MNLVVKAAVSIGILAVVLGAAGDVRAAQASAVVGQIRAHNKAFIAAYEAGNTNKMKSESAKSVALGQKKGLATNAVMADTYVLVAILDVEGKDDASAGVRDFGKALKIKSDVAIPEGMATSAVKAALKQARAQAALESKEKAGAVVATAPVHAGADKPAEAAKGPAPAAGKQVGAEAQEANKRKPRKRPRRRRARRPRGMTTRGTRRTTRSSRRSARASPHSKKTRPIATSSSSPRARASPHSKKTRPIATSSSSPRARVAALEKDKADRDKQLAASSARVAALEKDKADRDKQLAASSARVAALEKDKADRDKQLEKNEADHERELADARAREGKEREARQKVEHERDVAAAKEKVAAAQRKQEQDTRERLFAGPPLPARIAEPVHCEVPDEAPLRTDLFVHCVARPNLKARSIVFYYRAGTAHYSSTPMERTTKGWYAAIVPGGRVVGKSLQYYAEALDAREAVVASNGKEASPNILILRPSTWRAGVPRG